MYRFATATIIPVILLTLAGVFAGGWVWAALGYMTLLVFALDQMRALAAPARPGSEFPAGTELSVALASAHFPLLALAIWVVSGANDASWSQRIGAFVAFSLFFGQVSNSNAHELIHRSSRRLRRLGVAVYGTLLYGHHTSAHTLVHHVHVATSKDPNSARPGEHFYRFAWRAWRGEYRAGKAAETARRQKVNAPGMHPYVIYWGWGMLAVVSAFFVAGFAGVLSLFALAFYTQLQLLLSDYVQHYGLRRAEHDGRVEPCGPEHSWNAPHWYSSALMLNAPRHSDHHLRPGVPYPGLEMAEENMPTLPHSLPVMALIALWPQKWRALMDPRVARWQQAAQRGEHAAM